MTAINPLYGFLGRSTRATLFALPEPNVGVLDAVVKAGLQLGNEDPTKKHLDAYAEQLGRRMAGMPTDDQWVYGKNVWRDEDKQYVRDDAGTAYIPVWGMLFNRCGWACSYFTGYDFIRDAYAAALADPMVQRIVFDVDSFGGEVQGCMETTDWMFARRGDKPTLALANANACSAGYAIGSSASRMTAIESSNVGSVGVVLMHVDYSGYLEKNGIKVTLLFEGDHKVDGNPYQALPKAVREELQADLVKCRERFVGVVARNRSMSADDVSATEARVYDGAEAVEVGFIDAVDDPLQAIAAFVSTELSGSTPTKEYAMTTPQKPGAQATDESATPAATATPPAAAPAAAAPAAPATPSANDERARIKAIVGCDEAKGREQLANYFAFDTSMSADEAKKALAAAPKAAATGGANPFEAAMATSGNPNVGGDGPKAEGGDKGEDKTAALLRAWGQATGKKVE